jgi:hypothetical protein
VTAKTEREWEQAYDKLSELVSRLTVKKYRHALREAHLGSTSRTFERRSHTNPPVSEEVGPVEIGAAGPPPSDPTVTAWEASKARRGLLKKANQRMDAALGSLEAAAFALDAVLEGPDQRAKAVGYLRLAQRMGRL